MKKIDPGQTINTLANIGVLGGLIFVGMQLLQDRKVAEVSALNESENLQMYWMELIRESPEVWTKGLAGEPLSGTEAAEFERMATVWEGRHYSTYRSLPVMGLDPERAVREWALQLYSHPGLQTWWESHKKRIAYLDPREAEDDYPFNSAVDEELSRLLEDPPQFGPLSIP